MEGRKKTKKLDLRIDEALAVEAKEKAAQQGRPLSEVVRDLIRAWLADKPTASA
jgi:hypothetical protein